MDISEVRALSDKDLEGALRDAKQELWKVRFEPGDETGEPDSSVADAWVERSRADRDDRASARGRTGCRRRREGQLMQGKRRTKVGCVVSDKMDRTVVVSVERLGGTRSTSGSCG